MMLYMITQAVRIKGRLEVKQDHSRVTQGMYKLGLCESNANPPATA